MKRSRLGYPQIVNLPKPTKRWAKGQPELQQFPSVLTMEKLMAGLKAERFELANGHQRLLVSLNAGMLVSLGPDSNGVPTSVAWMCGKLNFVRRKV